MSEESKELDGNVSTAELLGEVKTAIRKILIGGQSYQIGSRKLTRADLYQLRKLKDCLLYTSPSPRDRTRSRMPSSA